MEFFVFILFLTICISIYKYNQNLNSLEKKIELLEKQLRRLSYDFSGFKKQTSKNETDEANKKYEANQENINQNQNTANFSAAEADFDNLDNLNCLVFKKIQGSIKNIIKN